MSSAISKARRRVAADRRAAVRPSGAGQHRSSYLVDPASSHMLVSKIKPCKCQYEHTRKAKLRMAH